MAVENRFFAHLAGVHKFSFMVGQLALSWKKDDKGGVMFFERKSSP
jgi:hypothetical protein